MIQVNRIYLIFNRLVTKKFLVDTSDIPEVVNGCKQQSTVVAFPHGVTVAAYRSGNCRSS